MVAWYDDMQAGNWGAAIARQQRMHVFMRASEVLYEGGNLHGILGKAIASCSPFLLTNNRTRRPYLPVREESISAFQRVVEEEFGDMVWRG